MIGLRMPEIAGLPIGWSTFLVTIFGAINIWIGRSIITLVQQRPKMRELEQSADDKLISTLSARVSKLEIDLQEQRDFYERKFDRVQATYDASQRLARHELNNVKMRLRALIMLLKRLPDPPPMLVAILADIEAMEAEQALAEAAEKGAQSGQQLAHSGGGVRGL